MVQSPWKRVWGLLTKLDILLPHNLAIALFGIHSKDLKTLSTKKTCTEMCIAALFITAKTWKQLRCPSVGE